MACFLTAAHTQWDSTGQLLPETQRLTKSGCCVFLLISRGSFYRDGFLENKVPPGEIFGPMTTANNYRSQEHAGPAYMFLSGSAVLYCLMLMSISSGCAAHTYTRGSSAVYYSSPELAQITTTQIERGHPNAFLDGFGWVWGIPAKIILFDRRVENHRIGPRTEAEIAGYLRANELDSVKVRLNQYHPADDWRRLVANKSVGAGWRYTLGTLSVAGETIFPGRLFGGDHYNPFTNTIHVYSDAPAIAVHEGGHAKDFAKRKWKGTWAAVYLIPGMPLMHEARATEDALTYYRIYGDAASQREAYNLLYPAYGSYVGGALGDPSGIAYLASVLAGHATGRWYSSRIEDPVKPSVRQEASAGDSSAPEVIDERPFRNTIATPP